MAAEVHAPVFAYEYGYIRRDVVEELDGRLVTLHTNVHNRTLLIVVAKDSCAGKERIHIVLALKKSHTRDEISNTGRTLG